MILTGLDLYMERYFATAMAIFALFLSGGSQIGPVIAGLLISSKGWRWFFILNSILISFNLATSLVLLPETNFKRQFFDGETAAEVDKIAVQQIEHTEKGTGDERTVVTSITSADRNSYAGNYWVDLVTFKHRGLEGGFGAWARQISLPFRFLLVPHALFAALSYGVFLGG